MEPPKKTKFAEFAELHEYAMRKPEAQPPPEDTIEYLKVAAPNIESVHVNRAKGEKGYYDVSFYVDMATPSDWNDFFKKLAKFHTYITLFVVMRGRRVHYILESDRYLENGNAIFHPFRVASIEKPQARYAGLFGLKLSVNEEFFSMDSNEHVKRNRSASVVMVKKLLKPGRPNFSMGRILYSDGSWDVLCIPDLASFLSFSMLTTMDKQVEKVKTELKDSDACLAARDKSGVLFSKDQVTFGIEDFDFYKHGLIVGQTGSGKSKLLELYARGLINTGALKDYTVVFLDPHGKVHDSIRYSPSKKIDFKTEAIELFTNVGEPPASTEFTQVLFSSFLFLEDNPQLARLLKHSLYLLFSIKKMSLNNLNLLLTDTIARKAFTRECDNEVLKKFFDTEFLEFKTQKYDSTILPIVNLINEYNFLSAGIGEAKQHSLADLLNRHPVLFISTNPSELGRKMTKLIGGALIQQLFVLLQSGVIKKKVILLVDEFSLVQNPAFAQILSESRKFGLTMVVAQQYLGQVDLELLQSMQANVSNLFCFKLNRKDAEIAKKMMTIEISKVFEKGKSFDEIEEKKIELLTESNPRECVFRVMQRGQFTRPIKASTVTIGGVSDI